MDSYTVTDEEYELQCYRFSANDFIDHFKHLISIELESLLDEYVNVVKSDLNTIAKSSYNISKLEAAKNDLIVVCNRELEEELKSAESAVRKFISIPKNVLLPIDKSQKRQYLEKEVQELDSEVQCLEKECTKEQLLIHLCKSEKDILHKFDGCRNVIESAIIKVSQLDTCNFKELTKLSLTYEECNDFKLEE